MSTATTGIIVVLVMGVLLMPLLVETPRSVAAEPLLESCSPGCQQVR